MSFLSRQHTRQHVPERPRVDRPPPDLAALTAAKLHQAPALTSVPAPSGNGFPHEPLDGSGPGTFTVLVADDAANTRQGLLELLGETSDIDCVATVGDAKTAIAAAAHHQPDVALLDVRMPEGGGLAAALGIREVSPRTRLLAYSVASDRASVVQMLRTGARGYVVKGAPAHELLEALRCCARGGRLSPKASPST